MSLISSTWAVLRGALADTADSLAKSVWGLTALVLILPIEVAAALLVSPLGFAGGILLSLLNSLLVGWYLALVGIAVLQRRRVTFADLKDQMGTHIWDVMSVLFIFWIIELALSQAPGTVHVIYVLVGTLVFNPAPELIYQGRTNSVGLLQDAASFMQNNWPEWLVAHVVGYAVIVPFYWFLSGGIDLQGAASILKMFGPWFGFTSAGTWLVIGLSSTLNLGILAMVGGTGLTLFCHAFLLFRGHLFQRLSSSSRRSRSWSARH